MSNLINYLSYKNYLYGTRIYDPLKLKKVHSISNNGESRIITGLKVRIVNNKIFYNARIMENISDGRSTLSRIQKRGICVTIMHRTYNCNNYECKQTFMEESLKCLIEKDNPIEIIRGAIKRLPKEMEKGYLLRYIDLYVNKEAAKVFRKYRDYYM